MNLHAKIRLVLLALAAAVIFLQSGCAGAGATAGLTTNQGPREAAADFR